MRILNRFAILGFLLLSACAPVPAQVPQTGSSNQPVSGRSPIQVLKVAQIGLPARHLADGFTRGPLFQINADIGVAV